MILYFFDELDEKIVERINIFGNFITDEKVIRNTLIVDEGDVYNDVLFKNLYKKLEQKIFLNQ